ncbi:BldC family transcriptional regulator [Cellulomonas sp. HZM]|uniref:BldC family transcriptional regulator n=1 Tax=Cellulomonas sp. HZM TaxID=1454010 RepID=UPI0004937FDE|nr:BldC family transcriptional regulator [Cellulomonas sp. HZM]
MATDESDDRDVLLTPAQVADLFGVDPKTVTRWARAGRLSTIRTLGGHRRYHLAEVEALRDVPTQSQRD